MLFANVIVRLKLSKRVQLIPYDISIISVPAIHGDIYCSKPISINCNQGQIIVKDTDASPHLAENIFLQCSAQRECQIRTEDKGCVIVDYHCRTSE